MLNKKQLLLSIITGILFPLFCNAQPTYFNRVYDVPGMQVVTSITELEDGGYIYAAQELAGTYRALYFGKIDTNGDTLLTKKYGQEPLIYYTGLGALSKTADSCYILAGSIIDSTNGVPDALLVKINKEADTLWTKRYGGSGFEAGRDCRQTTDGGYIIIASRDSLNNGNSDFYLIKTDSAGNVQWEKTYGTSVYESPLSGQPTLDGGYILSGQKEMGGGNYKHYVIKTDNSGFIEWQKTYGPNGDHGGCLVVQLADSNYILTGALYIPTLSKQGCIRKIDRDGEQLWEKTFGSTAWDSFGTKAVELADGSIVVAGSGFNEQNVREGWLMKVNKEGEGIWSRKYYNIPQITNYFYDLQSTQDGGFIMAGTGAVTSQDVWLVKVDSVGCEIYNCNVSIAEEQADEAPLKIYPNPNNGAFTLVLPNLPGHRAESTVCVYTVLGQEISCTSLLPGNELTIDMRNKPNGIYFIRLSAAGKSYFSKFIKQ